jgi:hypothetical protein
VQRFLQFHLTVNAVALLVTSGGVLMADNKSHGKPPFNPVRKEKKIIRLQLDIYLFPQ